jgi:hypothetical protein
MQIGLLVTRSKSLLHFKADPSCCTIAVYSESRERCRSTFADAAEATEGAGDGSSLDMLRDAGFASDDIVSDALAINSESASSAPQGVPESCARLVERTAFCKGTEDPPRNCWHIC